MRERWYRALPGSPSEKPGNKRLNKIAILMAIRIRKGIDKASKSYAGNPLLSVASARPRRIFP